LDFQNRKSNYLLKKRKTSQNQIHNSTAYEKITLLLSLFLLLALVKQTQNLLSSGNYDQAIDNAVSNLRSNKDKKGKQDYVYLLEEVPKQKNVI
jgi:hypothetical protein